MQHLLNVWIKDIDETFYSLLYWLQEIQDGNINIILFITSSNKIGDTRMTKKHGITRKNTNK